VDQLPDMQLGEVFSD